MVYDMKFSKGVSGEVRLADDARNTVSSRAAPRGREEARQSQRQSMGPEKAEAINLKQGCGDFFQNYPPCRIPRR